MSVSQRLACLHTRSFVRYLHPAAISIVLLQLLQETTARQYTVHYIRHYRMLLPSARRAVVLVDMLCDEVMVEYVALLFFVSTAATKQDVRGRDAGDNVANSLLVAATAAVMAVVITVDAIEGVVLTAHAEVCSSRCGCRIDSMVL